MNKRITNHGNGQKHICICCKSGKYVTNNYGFCDWCFNNCDGTGHNYRLIMPKKITQKQYCNCALYLSNGNGVCSFCNLPAKPLIINKSNLISK